MINTYEEWEEISTPKPAGIMTDAYTARQEAEEMASTVNNQAAWKEFLANVENDFAEVTEKYTAALDRAKELTEATDAATAARQAGLAKIDQQLAGLSNIAAQIQTILNDELGGTSVSVENLIAWVESEVNKLNGGGVTTSGDDYTFNTTGSIPAQEAVIASLEALLADLQAENGSFQAAAERAIERKQEAIAWQQAVVDATQALFDQLNALKDQYIAGMTGEAAPAE